MNNNTSKRPQITIYLPQYLIDAVKKEAKTQKRSMNSQVVWYLEKCLNTKQGEENKE